MPDELLERLRRFQTDAFPQQRSLFRHLVDDGQHPLTLFIGCSDSRLVPYLLTGAGPGELFLVRNVGAFVPPYDPEFDGPQAPMAPPPEGGARLGTVRRLAGFHGTAAAIEYAVLNLQVRRIIVCGHSHCGAIRALFKPQREDAPHISRWLELARPAMTSTEMTDEALRQAEMRSITLQVARLLTFPMVRERVERGDLCLHGWYYVIEEGRVLGLDIATGEFSPLS